MPKRENKAKTQERHTEKRLAERYGLKYTQFMHDTVLNLIHRNACTLVFKQSLRVSVLDVHYTVREADILDHTRAQCGNIKLRLAYDKHRKTLITALSPDMDPKEVLEDDLS